MATWQTYVDVNLVGSGRISKALILGQQNGVWRVWAASSGFKLLPGEEKAIVSALSNSDAVLASGLRLEGQKYFAIQADDRTVHLKKQADGVVIAKGGDVILVSQYVAPAQAGEVMPVINVVTEYLNRVKAAADAQKS